jgi:hypothetical protein
LLFLGDLKFRVLLSETTCYDSGIGLLGKEVRVNRLGLNRVGLNRLRFNRSGLKRSGLNRSG